MPPASRRHAHVGHTVQHMSRVAFGQTPLVQLPSRLRVFYSGLKGRIQRFAAQSAEASRPPTDVPDKLDHTTLAAALGRSGQTSLLD